MDEPQPVPLGVVKGLLEAELGNRENKHRCRDCGQTADGKDHEFAGSPWLGLLRKRAEARFGSDFDAVSPAPRTSTSVSRSRRGRSLTKSVA